jgi:NAD(P)-dependent dehydrogenase (short-subunit alcohol dehydrogenase family)
LLVERALCELGKLDVLVNNAADQMTPAGVVAARSARVRGIRSRCVSLRLTVGRQSAVSIDPPITPVRAQKPSIVMWIYKSHSFPYDALGRVILAKDEE